MDYLTSSLTLRFFCTENNRDQVTQLNVQVSVTLYSSDGRLFQAAGPQKNKKNVAELYESLVVHTDFDDLLTEQTQSIYGQRKSTVDL